MSSQPSSQSILITVRHLSKTYDGTHAVEDLSFDLKRGEILGILGPNGAGKTTTLHILLGILAPSNGSVNVLGVDPLRKRHHLSQKINFSSAYQYLPMNLKVWENLLTFARIYGLPDPRKIINELLERFEISYLKDRVVGALSSGERTKLNLAKCFLNDPELLVLDEPTASLDPDMADKVRLLLRKLQAEKNLGIIYTSHNMFEVETLCDRILFIHKGKKITEGRAKDIRESFNTDSLEQTFIKIVRGGDVITEANGE